MVQATPVPAMLVGAGYSAISQNAPAAQHSMNTRRVLPPSLAPAVRD
eukprot:SAG11_NODE_28688_length_319_cov_0.527273_1_plen_46_part_10